MQIIVRGYAPITLPAGLLPMQGSFDSHTPYTGKVVARIQHKSFIKNKLPLKLRCLELVRDKALALGGYGSYLEPFAGVGLSARILARDPERTALNDIDAGCRSCLCLNYPRALITGYDALAAHLPPAELIFLDPNDYTMKKGLHQYKQVVQRAAQAARHFLIIDDCSPFYLRYGAASFAVYSKLMGTTIVSMEDYFRAAAAYYQTLGWYLHYVAYYADTAFLLLARAETTTWELVRIDTALPGMITVRH